MAMDCLVCNGRSESFARATILARHEIEYFRCSDCEFIQTETPYWLDEAYDSAIVSTDVGLVGRNAAFSKIVDRTLRLVMPGVQASVDYGGGYGMFTRMMRDRGHDFSHYDPYCENLFARGYEVQPGAKQFDLVTAFEVFEHMADPHKDLKTLDALGANWIISTRIVPDPAPQPDQWWYYVLEGGQHIALWSHRALQSIASQYKRHLTVTRRGMHVFSQEKLNPFLLRTVVRNRSIRVFDGFRKRKSLLQADAQRAIERTRRRVA
ncbi:class I SAM-dependent methyltransferase [Novipirellula rosea]|uniref:Bifunctional 3-demethylubiquinone-9 3-methyltransferase/ 2-octaprenyl-6-hydroxy phenol methylase n=1 Tax=Novipirellula rosea TaxID=1031540 RepID=A0ABP8N340_9BACT|tara:strand:+ start:15667 stop:16461 length:795 start_codon:yes stop_codon:yes gene_type:complete